MSANLAAARRAHHRRRAHVVGHRRTALQDRLTTAAPPRAGDRWRRVLDDDWETRLGWAVTDRIVHRGAARDLAGQVRPFAGSTRSFRVR